MSREFIIVIPARYASSRFPGKPLIDIDGKTMIYRVWEKCSIASNKEDVFVATDDTKIKDHCDKHGMNVIMTSKKCLTGTDRVSEVADKINADFYINVQGDEPLINPGDITKVIESYRKTPDITYCAMTSIDSEEDYFNKNIPKVVVRNDGNLLYISRSGLPANKDGTSMPTMKQVCIYAFPKPHLKEFGLAKAKTNLESSEDIELLRLLELGHKIRMVEVSNSSIAVDTPQDLEKVLLKIND